MTLDTFYDEHAKSPAEQQLPSAHVTTDDPTVAFRLWTSRKAR